MLFNPKGKYEIIAEETFPETIKEVESELEKCKHSGSFSAFDKTEIYYEYFLAQNPKASVIIVHGLSEFTRKFYELSYYFLNEGYNVFIFDQRCHGLSGRLTDIIELLHVDRFDDYVLDLEQFIEEIVLPTSNQPIYIYSHSMGGAISALFLEKRPEVIKKAVFAAPMLEPTVSQVPQYVGRWAVRFGKIFLGSKKKFLLSGEFNPEAPYKKEYDPSRNRFEHNMKMRRENVYYQSTPMTFGWVCGALTVKFKILRKSRLKRIQTPILLLSAEKDKTVENYPQRLFSEKCKTCDFKEIKGIGHSLLSSDEPKMKEILDLVFEFFQK